MNFSYGKGNRVYGKDINEARYNALLETYYGYFSETKGNVKPGNNYFLKDPQTAQLLERRLISQDVYIPDEDEELLVQLSNAYKTTRYDQTQSCSAQKNEAGCTSLKFRGTNRCNYEKKWLSILRGGTCVVNQDLVEHLVNNLQPVMKIKWESLKVYPLKNSPSELPNPDEFTKEDISDLIHDLGYHIKQFFGEKDLTNVIEKNTGKNILDLSTQQLLYYLYLFSYIIYASWFLRIDDFKKIFTEQTFAKLHQEISQNLSGKNALINFIVDFNASIPQQTNRSKAPQGWNYASLVGPALVLLLFSFVPTADAFIRFDPPSGGGRVGDMTAGDNLVGGVLFLVVGIGALLFFLKIVDSTLWYFKTPEQKAEFERERQRRIEEEESVKERLRRREEREDRWADEEEERILRRHERIERSEQRRRR
jgi:hypothetical protein